MILFSVGYKLVNGEEAISDRSYILIRESRALDLDALVKEEEHIL